MQRTTIMLPADLKLRAQRLARERGVSLGDLVRQALDGLVRGTGTPSSEVDALLGDDAVWHRDVPADLSQHHDRYLYGEDV